jgi:hypothetical protein
MERIRCVAVIAAWAVLLSSAGCATIIRGKQSRVSIESLPSGATVVVDGQPLGKTPVEVTMTRDEVHHVKFTLNGHEDLLIQTDGAISGGYVTVDILFGAVWLLVDAVTGAWYEPGPRPLRVILSPKGQRCSQGECVYLQAPSGGQRR